MSFRSAFTSAFSPAFRPAYNTDAGGVPFVGLLELYGGAAIAYSLRSLVSEGNPKVLNVRRSSDQAEAEFFAKEVSTIAAWVGAGNDGFVQTWFDQSGNNKNLVQISAGQQPKIVENGVLVVDGNNNPRIKFDGVDDVLDAADPLTNSSGTSLFLTAEIVDGNSAANIARHGVSNPDVGWIFQRSTDSSYPLASIRCGTGTVSTSTAEKYTTNGDSNDKFGTQSLYGLNYTNGVGREISVNGTARLPLSLRYGQAQSSTFNSAGLLSLGASTTGASATEGTFSEFIIYDSDQSANRAGISSNIMEHYNI